MTDHQPSVNDDGADLSDDAGELSEETEVVCPYCGESSVIALDPGGGREQSYVEDCPVCCQPWDVRVAYDAAGQPTVTVDRLD